METRDKCCSTDKVGDQLLLLLLLLLPEDVSEEWRDVHRSHFYTFLPPSLSFPLFVHWAALRVWSNLV